MIQLMEAAQAAAKVAGEAEKIVLDKSQLDTILQQMISWSVEAGKNILVAAIVFIIGRFIVSFLNRLLAGMLERRHVETTIQTFLKSLVNILLMVLLVISVVSALGINTTSFAALLASAGVAIGMALSGNLQNLAGGLIILLFRPYKVGDWVEGQSVAGTVSEIQIFHTILITGDNKTVYVPNGAMSSGVITNYSRKDTRRVEWVIGVEYGTSTDDVRNLLRTLLAADKRVLADPEPFIAVNALADSSVNILIRAWVKQEDYWGVYFDMNKVIYEEFNRAGLSFPFPQLTIHKD
ncbi:MAG: mechanosensitive ion channel [Paraprevotella sp.]|nr:mechanosensitive ion channel [Paraprevotella sp.]MBP3471561.1 mechanosensitive ion channel [Paraprevotella sp.]